MRLTTEIQRNRTNGGDTETQGKRDTLVLQKIGEQRFDQVMQQVRYMYQYNTSLQIY